MKYELNDKVAVLHLDDGKANAVGYDLIGFLHESLDKASEEAGAVLLHGREGVLSDAAALAELPAANYAGNKLEIRAPYIETIKASLAD